MLLVNADNRQLTDECTMEKTDQAIYKENSECNDENELHNYTHSYVKVQANRLHVINRLNDNCDDEMDEWLRNNLQTETLFINTYTYTEFKSYAYRKESDNVKTICIFNCNIFLPLVVKLN